MTSTDTSSMRDRIFQRLRSNRPAPVEHPEIPRFAIPGEMESNFISHVETYDGKVVNCSKRDDAIRWLREHLRPAADKKVLSMIPDFDGNVTMSDLPTPQDAHELDACVAEGILGIGETGSILIEPETFGRASNGLLALNLYILLDRSKMVDGVQDAYSKMDLASTQYSSFFSGPSATADIEAVHITGAQGPLSLTVLLY